MSDILELPNSVISFVNFHASEKNPPRLLSASDDGLLAILSSSSLLIGVIGCNPTSEDTKYSFNPQKVTLDFTSETILKVSDFDFKHSIDDKLIEDYVIYNLMLDTNFTVASMNNKYIEYNNMEWSPVDILTKKTLLSVSRYDGHIIILAYNNIRNCWEKEFDITDLYFKYYKENLLQNIIEGYVVHCIDVYEYINLKNDLRLVDFSWSVLVRQYLNEQYYLLTTLSYSGIITVWRITVDHINCRCDIFYCERFKDEEMKPLNIKFCDISETSFLITIVDSKDLVKSCPFVIVDEGGILKMESLSKPFIIHQQMRHCQASKIQWSMSLSQLIIGFEWKLLIAKIIQLEDSKFVTETAILYIPSNSEIRGLYIKNHTAYVTSIDGFLFGIKLSHNINGIELSQILFQNPNLKGRNNEYLDVFVSPNNIYFGFLKLTNELSSKKVKIIPTIVIVSIASESQALKLLMDDNIPFSHKQDAVEEIRYLYFNQKEGLHNSLNKISTSDLHWENCNLHRLQLIRYICIFFGYKLNANHELVSSVNKIKVEATVKIRKLESIIIIKNISYWLDGFSEMECDEIVINDCLFVLRFIRKLRLLSDNNISGTIETAESQCNTVLMTKFHKTDSEVKVYKDVTEDITCIICGEKCEFNLFLVKCSQGHILPRCCKSLEICTTKFKMCQICGAVEKFVNTKDLSNWMMEIVNSNCPLCDGKLISANF